MNLQTEDKMRVEIPLNDYLEMLNENKRLCAALSEKNKKQDTRATRFWRLILLILLVGIMAGLLVGITKEALWTP